MLALMGRAEAQPSSELVRLGRAIEEKLKKTPVVTCELMNC